MANKKRLDITMENDFLQSFVRGNLNEQTDAKNDKRAKPSTSTSEVPIEIVKPDEALADSDDSKQKKSVKTIEGKPPGVCRKFHARNTKDKEVKGKKKVKRRTIRCEELYTDKDRAAAVNLGSRDIKHSLKVKQAQDRSKALHIPEQADPAQFLALGYYELKKQETQIALNFINKALELNPNEKNALVARSKCYILLGQPENGLKDAEAALDLDKKFLKAIYQKAESLYNLGDFEHSLMYFHRGLHIRPDHDDFKMGVEKAQKAIETALGVGVKKRKARSKSAAPKLSLNDDNNNVSTEKSDELNNNEDNNVKQSPITNNIKVKNGVKNGKSRVKPKSNGTNNKLLKELAVDKEYLESLLKNPNLQFARTKETDKVLEYVRETVDFLNKRQEFWRQQVPAKRH